MRLVRAAKPVERFDDLPGRVKNEATIFNHADYAVIGNLHEIVPAITAELRKVRGT